MTGHEGRRVRVKDRGGWDVTTGRLTGIDIVSDGGSRWKTQASALPSIAPPLAPETDETVWRNSDPPAVSLAWHEDDGGPFLRLLAQRESSSALLQWTPNQEVPLTVRIVARASRPDVRFWLTVYDDRVPPPNIATAREYQLGQSWQLLTLRAPSLVDPMLTDRVGGGPAGLAAGDYVDIRSIDVVAGWAPEK